jgi:hypothetical protein
MVRAVRKVIVTELTYGGAVATYLIVYIAQALIVKALNETGARFQKLRLIAKARPIRSLCDLKRGWVWAKGADKCR